MFGGTESKLIGNDINILIPEVLNEAHNLFIKRFLAEGVPRKLGKLFYNLMKTADGYLIPIEQNLNIIYH